MDQVEELAISRLKEIFGCEHANVQPYSGSPANQAVYRALLKPGDKVMGMPVTEGGHLTHGWKVNFSGVDFESINYGVDQKTGLIDYDKLSEIANKEKPKLIWIGCTAYSRILDYEKVAKIAKEINAYVAADISHISGLIIGGVHPNPVPFCHVISSTSHKTLRGPRGGFILSRVEDEYQNIYHSDSKFNLAQRIDRAVFPFLQGGPHINSIAALAVALKEANSTEFKLYSQQIVRNAKTLADTLTTLGYKIVSGGTDNHTVILDFNDKEYSGKTVAKALAKSGIITNFNMVPGDKRKPFITSGVRIGTAAVTTMGMREQEMIKIGNFIDKTIKNIEAEPILNEIAKEVADLCKKYNIPGYYL